MINKLTSCTKLLGANAANKIEMNRFTLVQVYSHIWPKTSKTPPKVHIVNGCMT